MKNLEILKSKNAYMSKTKGVKKIFKTLAMFGTSAVLALGAVGFAGCEKANRDDLIIFDMLNGALHYITDETYKSQTVNHCSVEYNLNGIQLKEESLISGEINQAEITFSQLKDGYFLGNVSNYNLQKAKDWNSNFYHMLSNLDLDSLFRMNVDTIIDPYNKKCYIHDGTDSNFICEDVVLEEGFTSLQVDRINDFLIKNREREESGKEGSYFDGKNCELGFELITNGDTQKEQYVIVLNLKENGRYPDEFMKNFDYIDENSEIKNSINRLTFTLDKEKCSIISFEQCEFYTIKSENKYQKEAKINLTYMQSFSDIGLSYSIEFPNEVSLLENTQLNLDDIRQINNEREN